MSMKNLLTLVGIESATFRFVTQHLNHCPAAFADGETGIYDAKCTSEERFKEKTSICATLQTPVAFNVY